MITTLDPVAAPVGAAAPVCEPDLPAMELIYSRPDALTAATTHLIGESELRAMKPSALLINTARGGLVDEAALARALHEGWIAGAGFDVLSIEPPRAGNVLLAPELLALPNFVLTPHVAWASQPAMQVLANQLVDNLEAFARGEPRNRVA